MPSNNVRLGRRLWEDEYPGSLWFVPPDVWEYAVDTDYQLVDRLERRLRLGPGRSIYVFIRWAVWTSRSR